MRRRWITNPELLSMLGQVHLLQRQPPMRPARVLLVDDRDLTLWSALCEALAEHEVETANDAVDAIYKIDCTDDPPDAIVCDLSRGDMPGPELWSYLSLTRREAAERMVFVASGPLTNEARTFLRCVPNPFIELPRQRPERC